MRETVQAARTCGYGFTQTGYASDNGSCNGKTMRRNEYAKAKRHPATTKLNHQPPDSGTQSIIGYYVGEHPVCLLLTLTHATYHSDASLGR